MIHRKLLQLAFVLITAFSLLGCEIEQTQEGKLPNVDLDVKEGNLPKFEVRQTEEGKMPEVDVDVKSGQLPKYDVDSPNIVVGTKEMDVEVPDVDINVTMEKETIDVPIIGIDMPDDEDVKGE